MSKESSAGFPCKCGVRIFYQEYHWPHCPENPRGQKAVVVKARDTQRAEEVTKGIRHG